MQHVKTILAIFLSCQHDFKASILQRKLIGKERRDEASRSRQGNSITTQDEGFLLPLPFHRINKGNFCVFWRYEYRLTVVDWLIFGRVSITGRFRVSLATSIIVDPFLTIKPFCVIEFYLFSGPNKDAPFARKGPQFLQVLHPFRSAIKSWNRATASPRSLSGFNTKYEPAKLVSAESTTLAYLLPQWRARKLPTQIRLWMIQQLLPLKQNQTDPKKKNCNLDQPPQNKRTPSKIRK